MILFLDTSALVKLYVEETGGDVVMRLFHQARLLAVSERLKQSACRLLATHSLRSLDAIQLASALIVKSNRRQQILFASFDAKLNLAAKAAGLTTLQTGSATP
jgi:predicted nucleic acid-binding protein